MTKYPQSCLLVEAHGARLLFDPGAQALTPRGAETFGRVDAVFYTHRHSDHFDVRLLADYGANVRVVCNADVATLIQDSHVEVVADGQEVFVGGVSVAAHELAHCATVDGLPGPPNTGFLVAGEFLHPGDSVETALSVSKIALPISGPSISMADAYRMVASTGATAVLPIHYDVYPARPERFAQACGIAKVVLAEPGQTVEL